MRAAQIFNRRHRLCSCRQADGFSRALVDCFDAIATFDDIGLQADRSWSPVQLKEQATRVADCVMSVRLLVARPPLEAESSSSDVAWRGVLWSETREMIGDTYALNPTRRVAIAAWSTFDNFDRLAGS